MQTGVARRIIGVNFDESLDSEKTVRNGAEIVLGGRCVGRLVNAGYSYALKRWIGLALIEDEFACVGVRYSVQTERSLTAIESVSAPFLFNKSMTIRPQEDSFFA
jgi:glycine cleavage system aminomethyltransferase T